MLLNVALSDDTVSIFCVRVVAADKLLNAFIVHLEVARAIAIIVEAAVDR
jgi:hypothetical protein